MLQWGSQRENCLEETYRKRSDSWEAWWWDLPASLPKPFLSTTYMLALVPVGTMMSSLPGPSFCPQHMEAQALRHLLAMEGVRLVPRPLESKSTVLGKRPSLDGQHLAAWKGVSVVSCSSPSSLKALLSHHSSSSQQRPHPRRRLFFPVCRKRLTCLLPGPKGKMALQ